MMVKRRDIIRRKHTKAAQVKVEKAVDNTNKTLVLSEPFNSLSGVNIKELTFKFSGLKPNDYRQIVRLEAKLSGGIPSFDFVSSKKTSPEFRMGAAWIAAVKGTPGLCVDDIDSVAVRDLLEMEEVGMLFFAGLG